MNLTDNSKIQSLKNALNEVNDIIRIIDKICRVRETNHIMSIIINELTNLIDADQGVINLLTPHQQDELVTVIRKKNESESAILPYKVDDMISGWVLREKITLKIDDLDNDKRFDGLSSENGLFKSILCFPMFARGEVIGLTSLIRGEGKGPFNNDQTRFAGIIISQSAQILSNAVLLEELAKQNELLEISRSKLNEENIQLRSRINTDFAFENIIGKSDMMKRVLTLASKVSANNSPVLITGSTGTGKELIARAIHYNSERREKPFVIKNCGVKTESLLEAELFGHVKGAFTGADRNKPGLFKESDGGTIFLDEIGDAPLSTQVAILRVLETGEIRPVGATKTEYVDVRIISATNKNLKIEIEKDRFRKDLYYRLNTFTIELPSLSQRRDDIPLLVHHFSRKLGIKLGIDKLLISPAALKALCNYHWPGNIRQLENEIERAAVVCDSDKPIDISDLSPELIGSASDVSESKSHRGKLREIVAKVESDIISSALAENKGNILKTSKALGLTRKGLRDKIARYSIKHKNN